MSHKPQSAAVIIHRRHQSAPKAHWADKEIQKAAEEIDGGRYVPDNTDESRVMDGLGVALGMGKGGVAKGEAPTLEDFRATRDMNELAMHPRVAEAMERMKQEVEDGKTPQERVEAAWKLREMTERQASRNKWEGQERWEDPDAEARAHGTLLTPAGFYQQLTKTIGIERIYMLGPAIHPNPGDTDWIVGLYIKNPRYAGVMPTKEYAAFRAGELRAEAKTEYTKGKKLRVAGFNALADKAMQKAANALQAATEILMNDSADRQLAEPEFLRVGTLQGPLGTEWMVMNFDEFGVPTTAKFVGWRTALLTMIRLQVITEVEAHRAFPLSSGPAGNWYMEQLYMGRNDGERVN